MRPIAQADPFDPAPTTSNCEERVLMEITERMVEEVTILELKGTRRLMMGCVSFQRGQTLAFPPVSMGRKMGRKKGCHA